MNYKCKPNTLVVFEGVDKAGKTTARTNCGFDGSADGHTAFHMPTGVAQVSHELYRYMETAESMRPLARQLVHLACHEENMPAIHEAFNSGMVVLDRWWWSTYAYGYRAGELDVRISPNMFMQILAQVWTGLSADVVYLFTEPYEEDYHNSEVLQSAYDELAAASAAGSCVRVPTGTETEVRDFILDDMIQRGLLIP